ncbi:MAG TPA: efflux RND transporter periplasmic adaptor subunit [Bacteroidales bacterium]|nr:efflux RND transporter periplasmic adaptor subunit [Bacteroidales bacterium]
MKRTIYFTMLLIVAASCSEKKQAVVTDPANSVIPVRVIKAELRQYIPVIELSGTAFADKEANLGAALPGRVEKIYFPEGSRVKKGDLLVSLSGELYTQAMVELNTVTKDYERVTRLNEKGSISQQDFDHVKAMYDASVAKVEMMKKNAEIIAPFSGTIVEYLVNEGENYFFNLNLEPGYSSTSGILRLMKLDPIQVEAEVNEKDLMELKKGQSAIVKFDAFPTEQYNGRISDIGQVLSTLTHTAKIRVEISNRSGEIKPGMFAHIKIECPAASTTAVPYNSIIKQAGTAEEYAYVAQSSTVKRIKIKRLWDDSGWTGVEGITPGQTVIVAGKEKLQDGSAIEIRQEENK